MRTLALTGSEPLALKGHARQATRSLAYLLAGLALSALYFIAMPTALLGGATALRRLLELERTLANRLLAARIPALRPVMLDERIDRRDVAFLASRLPLYAFAAALCAIPAALLVELLVHSVEGFVGSSSYLGPWPLGQPVGFVLLLFSFPALVLFAATLIACCSQLVQLTRHALTSRVSTGVAVREALAGRLRDRTLVIAYWLPERELFVDERGHVVELPSGDSGRAWTAVEHGGRRVAAIIHDAELEARPELVEAAAAGAVLALGNEQLKADLRARLVELRASRRRIVEASLETRKRLERDLHDGAQQQLVSLSVDLQLLQTRITDAPTLELLETSRAKLAEALADLRELARGIHPAVLTARGLAPALEALAQRAPLPVELTVDLSERPPASLESAAYFLVSEALTNVAKYAEASGARVFVTEAGGLLTVQIEDDGIGGADPSPGSGLRGLSDRIAALDGRLEIESAPGVGTRISATIPLKRATAGPPTRHESSG